MKKHFSFLVASLVILTGCEQASNNTNNNQVDNEKYQISFLNDDGTLLKNVQVEAGEIPDFNGSPVKDPANPDFYVFDGWEPQLIAASADASYIAKYRVSDKYDLEKFRDVLEDLDKKVDSKLLNAFADTKMSANKSIKRTEDTKSTIEYGLRTDALGARLSYTFGYEAFKSVYFDKESKIDNLFSPVHAKVSNLDFLAGDFTRFSNSDKDLFDSYMKVNWEEDGYRCKYQIDLRKQAEKQPEYAWSYTVYNIEYKIVVENDIVTRFYFSMYINGTNGTFGFGCCDFANNSFSFAQGQRATHEWIDSNKPAEERLPNFSEMFLSGKLNYDILFNYRYWNNVMLKSDLPDDYSKIKTNGFYFVDHKQKQDYEKVFLADFTENDVRELFNEIYNLTKGNVGMDEDEIKDKYDTFVEYDGIDEIFDELMIKFKIKRS